MFQTSERISEPMLRTGLRSLVGDAVCSQTMGTFAAGTFLVALALQMGASNLTIGMIAALGPLSQVLQVPAVMLIDRVGSRRAVVVVASLIARAFWLLAAVTPWLVPEAWRVEVFLGALLGYYGLGTVSGLAFNAWMRDLIPESIRGSNLATRLAVATAVAALLSLATGAGVDWFKQWVPETAVYSAYLVLAWVAGWAGVWFLSRIPEPRPMPSPAQSVTSIIAEPLRDRNFTRLLWFLGAWNFAVNLAAPFFTVFMLKRLELDMTVIMALMVASQVANVSFLRIWGRLADRFSNKSVLLVSGPLFLFGILIWTFTDIDGVWTLTVPLLVAAHVLAGISTAGISLSTGNIALKLAPEGRATAYLAVNALVSGIAAAVAPLLGGALGAWFESRELRITLSWFHGDTLGWAVPTLSLRGLNILFVIAFVVGLYAMHRLLAVHEEGEVEKGVFLEQFRSELRKAVRNVANVAGLRDLFYFPFARLREPDAPAALADGLGGWHKDHSVADVNEAKPKDRDTTPRNAE